MPYLRLVGILVAATVVSTNATAGSYKFGDVFASIGGGLVDEYTPTGIYVQTLNTTAGGFTTGSTFDKAGNFYVTDFTANHVSKFDTNGNLAVANWTTGLGSNESIVFDSAGNAYIGNAGASQVLKVDANGVQLAKFSVQSNTDWIDLAADQKTLIYSDESSVIRQFDVSTNTPLPNFATGVGPFFAKRILGNGDVLVASGSGNAYRFGSTGSLLQTYAAGIGSIFALNLDPDGKSFWTGATGGTTVEQIDIASGAILEKWNTRPGTLYGLSVLGEIQAGGGGVALVPEPSEYALMLAGLGLIGFFQSRTRKRLPDAQLGS